MDVVRDRRSVEILKDIGDVVKGAGLGVGEEACSRVLDILSLLSL